MTGEDLVPYPLMPSGVEHTFRDFLGLGWLRVPYPLMPSGVEHGHSGSNLSYEMMCLTL